MGVGVRVGVITCKVALSRPEEIFFFSKSSVKGLLTTAGEYTGLLIGDWNRSPISLSSPGVPRLLGECFD